MLKPALRLLRLKPARTANEIRDEDAAELEMWDTLIAQSIEGKRSAEERNNAKIAAGAVFNLKAFTYTNGHYERILRATAAGGAK